MPDGLIDVHAHVVLEGVFGAAGHYGPELTEDADGTPLFRAGDYVLHGVRYRDSVFMDTEVRIAAMDEAGIAVQVLSPNPITLFHSIEPELAIPFCQRHNELLADLVAEHPARLQGFAALPMQDLDAAIVELERATDELGLLAPYIGSDFGRQLDDPTLDDFYAAVVARDVPLFIHPAPSGSDGGRRDARLGRWDLELIVGFAYDETIAALTLVYGGVLERHPALDVCLSHGAGALTSIYGRALAGANRPWASDSLRREGAFAELVRRLWFDVHVKSGPAQDALIALASPDRLVYGTNFGGWDQPSAGERHNIELPRGLNDNARRLLRI
jgi:aminocarboxymuconate-semialdehyde decarboxylase